jgi:nicotinamide-nucleotide amidase
MRVEVLAVGTELLLGQIVNSNAAEIATRLADHGLSHHHQAVVGDNAGRMAAAIREATSRSDALIITGGIGPTQDDVTREVVAEVAGVGLVFDEVYAEAMRLRFESLGREFPSSNLRQAHYPEGAVVIPNHKGTAPGFRVLVGSCWVIALPGVPQEMLDMLDTSVVPFLVEASGTDAGTVVSRVLRSWGLSEAALSERLDDLFVGSTNPTVAFLASSGVIKVRLTARAANRAEAEALIAPVEAEVRDRLGGFVFGTDDDTIERIVHDRLAALGWTVGTAESATAGLVAARLASLPGSSDRFRGSIVAYASDLKTSLLGVPEAVIDEHGVVSEETALAMARGATVALGCDVAVSVTGVAGPDPLDAAIGTMCVAVVTPHTERVRTFRMPGDRERVRTYTATAALHQIRIALGEP